MSRPSAIGQKDCFLLTKSRNFLMHDFHFKTFEPKWYSSSARWHSRGGSWNCTDLKIDVQSQLLQFVFVYQWKNGARNADLTTKEETDGLVVHRLLLMSPWRAKPWSESGWWEVFWYTYVCWCSSDDICFIPFKFLVLKLIESSPPYKSWFQMWPLAFSLRQRLRLLQMGAHTSVGWRMS